MTSYLRHIYLPVMACALLILFSCRSTKDMSAQVQTTAGAPPASGKNIETPNTPVFIEACKQKILGNTVAAEKLFMQCLIFDPNDAASMFELAKIYLGDGKTQDALIMAKQSVDEDPDNIYYSLLLANIYQKSLQYKESVHIFERLTKKHPENLDFTEQLAVSLLLSGEYEKAISVYDDLEEKIGITEEISIKKQQLFLQVKKYDEAVREIEKLIGQYPAESRYYEIMAEMCLKTGMDDKAMWAYEKIAEIDPGNPYVHISLSDYYRKKGDKERSLAEMKAGFENLRLDAESKVKILLSYYAVNEFMTGYEKEALELAAILVRVHPEDPRTHSVYADLLLQAERFKEARDELIKVIALDSSRYVVWEQLLFLESQLNETDSLLILGKRASGLFPEQPMPYLFTGSALYQKKQWTEAIDWLNNGLELAGDNRLMLIQFHSYLGDAYYQVDDYVNSDKNYERVLQMDEGNSYVLNNYAYFLSVRNEKLDLAEKYAKKATELDPGNSSSEDTYGWVLYKLGKFDEAVIWIEKAVKSGGENNSVILEHLGDVHYKLGNTGEALLYWEKALNAGKGSDLLERKIKEKLLIEQ